MASLTICDRISKRNHRFTIEDVKIQGNVSDLKAVISKQVDVAMQDIELVYCGQCLKDQMPVEGYGVKPGATIFAVKKQNEKEDPTPGPVRDSDIRQMKSTLKSALINPAYRATVERLLADPQELDRILDGTPGLGNDPVALAMLHDPELLAILINPANINSVLCAHPALAQAAMIVSETVNKEGLTTGTSAGASSTGTYSLDQMSDDEDGMAAQPSGSSGSGQAITASQLAAALSAATGSLSSPGTSRQADTPSRITADFFQQALMQAQGAHAAPPDENTIQAQLQQLRDMGIADEDVARRALQASGGDIQMALNLIFGDGNI